jgi:uncharacterized membrane protein
MKLSYKKYPFDIILCIIATIFILFLINFKISGIFRILVGVPFLLFIPGYLLIFALFPKKKTNSGIDLIERIALSLGFSMVIVPLVGLGLNYTPWGIKLMPILLSISFFNIFFGAYAYYRWNTLKPQERFTFSFDITVFTSKEMIDKGLTIVLLLAIVLTLFLLVYVISTTEPSERFTEFYLLDEGNMAINYPINLSVNQNTSVTVGVVNHEKTTISYTIEAWLLNQSTLYNVQKNDNITVIHDMWYISKNSSILPHRDVDVEHRWTPQYEYNFSFSINKTGTFKLVFLLFNTPTPDYDPTINYANSAEEKLASAYRTVHLWINVT